MNKIKKTKDFPSRIIEKELYIVDPQKNTLHNLNKIGTRIWQILDYASTKDDIICELLREFDVDESMLRRDLEAFLSKLEKNNLIKYR